MVHRARRHADDYSIKQCLQQLGFEDREVHRGGFFHRLGDLLADVHAQAPEALASDLKIAKHAMTSPYVTPK